MRYQHLVASSLDRLLDVPERVLVRTISSKRRAQALASRGRRWLKRRWLSHTASRPVQQVVLTVGASSPSPGVAAGRGDRFVLYRIVGNDLYPRHDAGQSLANLRFILEHEPRFKGCEKRWLLNRIRKNDKLQELMAILEDYGCGYDVIPFEPEAFKATSWDWDVLPSPDYLASSEYRRLIRHQRQSWEIAIYRHKNNYLMNNNGARNRALELGRLRADWVLPWDGNCFLTVAGWESLNAAVLSQSRADYFHVPMLRVADNAQLLDPSLQAEPRDEPQLVFAASAAEHFNDAFPYGRRPKVELFWRLGLPGPWDGWVDERWDQPRRPRLQPPPSCPQAGWVARLHSGVRDSGAAAAVLSQQSRYEARNTAIKASINQALLSVGDGLSPSAFEAYWRLPLLQESRRQWLEHQACAAERLLLSWQHWWHQGGSPPQATPDELISAFLHLFWNVLVVQPQQAPSATLLLDRLIKLWFVEDRTGLQPRVRLLRRRLAPGRLPGTEPSVSTALQLVLLSDLLTWQEASGVDLQNVVASIPLFSRWRELLAQQLEGVVHPPWLGSRTLDLQRLQLVQVLIQRHRGRLIEPADLLLKLLSQLHPDRQDVHNASPELASWRSLILALTDQHGLLDAALAQRLGWDPLSDPIPPLASIPSDCFL